MKIAIIRRYVGFSLGGAESYAANCAIELKKLGHDVTVIADKCLLSNVDFLRAPVFGRGSFIKNLSFFLSVKRVIKSSEFDFIYACSRNVPSHLIRISDPLHIKWMQQRYGTTLNQVMKFTPRHSLLLWLEKISIEKAEFGVVTNSGLVKKHVAHSYNYPENRIYPIHNGVNFERFNLNIRKDRYKIRSQLGVKSSGEKLLIFVGSDWKRKGLDILIEALKMLPKNIRLIVAGGKKRQSGKRIRFLGHVRNIERLYAASDLLVIPTRYDPFSNVVLEALSSGLPVITTRWNGASEIICEGKTGLVTDLNAAALAEAIINLLEKCPDPETCHNSVKHLTWQKHVEELLSLYKSCSC